MTIFSYHLVELPAAAALKGIAKSPIPKGTFGLVHCEYMTVMTLGSPVFSRARMLLGQVAVFMQWQDEQALDDYLARDTFGKKLAAGWHVRLSFMRQWGTFTGFRIPSERAELDSADSAVVAVTVARMKPWAVPRFIRWGRPVEMQVRDNPNTTISLAAVKIPNTVSTFSIWNSVKDMTDMVHGHSAMERPQRHQNAMKERDRKDFHFEFSTLRFRALSEHGSWKGTSRYVPDL